MRIPVHDFLEANRDPVLNLNHVAELLSHQAQTADWQASWHSLIEAEKLTRFKMKEDLGDDEAKPAAAGTKDTPSVEKQEEKPA